MMHAGIATLHKIRKNNQLTIFLGRDFFIKEIKNVLAKGGTNLIKKFNIGYSL
jgi:hypothetical protein